MPNRSKGTGKSDRCAFLETSENDPIVEEISENQVKVATMRVNISDISGENACGQRIGPANGLSL